ncbi:MAG TPA: hypothetical protein VK756_02925 [Solirubrobacteraceae bacterium]|nr:hypothetical protein [Solirubrobacteraceae bacterium]
MATVVHPHIEPWEFGALQDDAGWSRNIELIGGEAVVVTPEGGTSSAARGELHVALRRWQEDAGDEGLALQQVFVAFPDVRELWLVDPDARTITRVRPDTGPDEELGERESLRSDLLPGLTLDLARVFRH